MKKVIYYILFIFCAVPLGYLMFLPTLTNEVAKPQLPAKDSVPPVQDTIPLGLQKLIAAYPEQQFTATSNYLIWSDGTKMLYQDSIINKSFEALLNNPDLEDQMQMHYSQHDTVISPSRNDDPGRIRYEPFFFKMYGNNKALVQQKLVTINFLGTAIRVTTVNNIDKKLSQIAKELIKYPDLKKYLEKVGGTFNWRKIAGTNRMSTHSFGMTIDINTAYANYWRWAVSDKRENGKRIIEYKNRIPMQLVRIFEAHGFIWGGRWYHYDTMHFEYRPELLINLKKT